MPGTSTPLALTISSRAFSVRVAAFTSGNTACTLPLKVISGTAVARACTLAPGRNRADWLSGTSAVAHTVPRPLMRNSVTPGITVIPSRTASSVTTPPMGATNVVRGWVWPLESTSAIWAALMPTWRMRWRDPSTKAARSVPCIRLTDKNSSCAATQSGTYISASGCPLLTWSSVARTCNFST